MLALLTCPPPGREKQRRENQREKHAGTCQLLKAPSHAPQSSGTRPPLRSPWPDGWQIVPAQQDRSWPRSLWAPPLATIHRDHKDIGTTQKCGSFLPSSRNRSSGNVLKYCGPPPPGWHWSFWTRDLYIYISPESRQKQDEEC